MHPPLVVIGAAHAAPSVALLEQLDVMARQQLRDLHARDARFVEQRCDRAAHQRAWIVRVHCSKMSPGARVRTPRSIAVSSARTASASTCASGASTPPVIGDVANTTSPSNGVATGVMRRYSAALAARASAAERRDVETRVRRHDAERRAATGERVESRRLRPSSREPRRAVDPRADRVARTGDDLAGSVAHVAERVHHRDRPHLEIARARRGAAESTLHRASRSRGLPDRGAGSGTDRALDDVGRRVLARVVRHCRRRTRVESAERREVEQHGSGDDRHDSRADVEAASALLHPPHHARGRVEPVGGPATRAGSRRRDRRAVPARAARARACPWRGPRWRHRTGTPRSAPRITVHPVAPATSVA